MGESERSVLMGEARPGTPNGETESSVQNESCCSLVLEFYHVRL